MFLVFLLFNGNCSRGGVVVFAQLLLKSGEKCFGSKLIVENTCPDTVLH